MESLKLTRELKSCPFCGSTPQSSWLNYNLNREPHDWYVGCDLCDIGFLEPTQEEAEQKWNTRCNEWIPIEDGLPKKDGWVLTTVEFVFWEKVETQSYVMDLYFYSHNKTFVDNRRGKKSPMFDRTTQVIAWKNMPETYEKSSLSSNSDRNGGQRSNGN